jgi:hypothetical protein
LPLPNRATTPTTAPIPQTIQITSLNAECTP